MNIHSGWATPAVRVVWLAAVGLLSAAVGAQAQPLVVDPYTRPFPVVPTVESLPPVAGPVVPPVVAPLPSIPPVQAPLTAPEGRIPQPPPMPPLPSAPAAFSAAGIPQPPPIPPLPNATAAIPAAVGSPAPAAPAADKSFEAVWNNGLFLKSKDGNFSAHVGGTIHYDGAWYTGGRGVQRFPGGVGRFEDGVNARRMRIYLEGTLYKDFDYKFEIEFMNGFSPAGLAGPAAVNTVSNSPGPTDGWVQAKNVPLLGNVRIGSQKEWFSLEHLEGYRSLLYMERSYLFDFSQATAFNNGFSPGVSAFNAWECADKRLFTAVGMYKNESDLLGYGVGNGNYAVTGRVAGLPVWLPDDQIYWHVGGAMTHRDPVNGQVQVRIRNAVRNAPFPLLNLIANTGAVTADSQTLFNLETAAAYGPLTVSGEYTANLINGARVGNGPDLGTLAYQGFYAQGMVFLTGEHRAWDPNIGSFKRVVPRNNFSPGHGTWGAVEVGGRYTYLNLDDKGVNGGRLNNVTLGTTWYWNPNVRLQFNYDYVYRDGGSNPLAKGAIHSLGTRLAMDF
jgi:phosphate-selective porin OprO and OprP